MKALSPFDVVQVAFPYVETAQQKIRPAVVVTTPAFHECGLTWCLMITSAKHRPWSGDVEIIDLAAAGLVKPCVVRTAKIRNRADQCYAVPWLSGRRNPASGRCHGAENARRVGRADIQQRAFLISGDILALARAHQSSKSRIMTIQNRAKRT